MNVRGAVIGTLTLVGVVIIASEMGVTSDDASRETGQTVNFVVDFVGGVFGELGSDGSDE